MIGFRFGIPRKSSPELALGFADITRQSRTEEREPVGVEPAENVASKLYFESLALRARYGRETFRPQMHFRQAYVASGKTPAIRRRR